MLSIHHEEHEEKHKEALKLILNFEIPSWTSCPSW